MYGVNDRQSARTGKSEVGVEPAWSGARPPAAVAGPGISAEYRDRAFLLFQRLRQDSEGMGIVLAVRAKITQRHHGRIRTENTPGGGAKFLIEFPEPR